MVDICTADSLRELVVARSARGADPIAVGFGLGCAALGSRRAGVFAPAC